MDQIGPYTGPRGGTVKITDSGVEMTIDKEDGVTIHRLKTWPRFFEAVISEAKTFEVRENDRDFKVGDRLVLREWDPVTESYTGRSCGREITYIMRGGIFGVAANYVVLALRKPY